MIKRINYRIFNFNKNVKTIKKKVPDLKVLTIQQMKQQPQQQSSVLSKLQIKAVDKRPPSGAVAGSSSLGSETDRSSSSSTMTTNDHLGERAKMCGTLFERKPVINQEIFDEFFRREPCLYSQRRFSFFFYSHFKLILNLFLL